MANGLIAKDDTSSDWQEDVRGWRETREQPKPGRVFVQCYVARGSNLSETDPTVMRVSGGQELVTRPTFSCSFWAAALYPRDPAEKHAEYEEPLDLIAAPIGEALTNVGWTLCPQTPDHLQDQILAEATAEIGRLLSDLAQRTPLRRSAGLKRLAGLASRRLREKEPLDVKTWARRLSQDVADAID